MNDQVNTISDCYATQHREGTDPLRVQTDDHDSDRGFSEINIEHAAETQHTHPILTALNNTRIRFPQDVSEVISANTDGQAPPISNTDTYRSVNHASTLLARQNEQRKDGKYCDVVVQCGSQRIAAHKTILAASSEYFCKSFEEDNRVSGSATVAVPDLNETAVKKLVEFIYTGDMQLTTDTVQHLLAAATVFQLDEAQDACWNFIIKRLHPMNCFAVLRIGEMVQKTSVVTASWKYIKRHFESLEQSDELLMLNERLFTQLISSEWMSSSEDKRLKAIIRWVNHDPTVRANVAPELCRHVRICNLSRAYLLHLSHNSDHWRSASWLTELLMQAFSCQLNQVGDLSVGSGRSPEYTDVLVVAGGWGGGRTVERFNLQAQSWSTTSDDTNAVQSGDQPSLAIPDLPRDRKRCAAVVVDHLLYVIGGVTDCTTRSIEIYDQHQQRWMSGPEMQVARRWLGATVLHRKIYAIGGRDDNTTHDSVEILDPLSDNWRFVSPMSSARLGPGVAACNNQIFAVGGIAANGEVLASSESYTPETNSWTVIAYLPTPRYDLSLCVLENRVYAVGGCPDLRTVCTDAHVFVPETNSWKTLAKMNTKRAGLGFVSYDGHLYAIGGWDGSTFLETIERYDPSSDQWTILPVQLKEARCDAGVAVLRLEHSK